MKKLLSATIAFATGLFLISSAQAAVVQFDYTQSFGQTPADGPAPWATAVFDDGGSDGSVILTIDTAATIGSATFKEFYFNLADGLDATQLSFTQLAGTGPTQGVDWSAGTNSFQADGDGIYDLLLELPPPPGQTSKRFEAGETLVFEITGIGTLSADDFNYWAEMGGGNGPYLSAAKIQSTGVGGADSDWVGVVPIPAAVWLFGSALGMLGWIRRRSITS